MGGAVLIVNPYASRVTHARVAAVRAVLPGPVELRPTTEPGHARELARDAVAEGASAIYVFSGDGVYNEVLNGIDGSTPVGFLPGGGTSVLPRALGLPRDPVEAARRIGRGATRRISLGRCNGRRFSFSAGIGFDAELVRRVDQLGRKPDGRRPGDAAFVWAAVCTVLGRRGRYDEALDLDDLGRAAFALVANCDPYTFAGGVALHVSSRARFELGLDVVAPRRVRARDVPRLLVSLVRGGLAGLPGVVSLHDVDALRIRCDRPLPAHVDGEDIGDVTEALVEAERDAITVFV